MYYYLHIICVQLKYVVSSIPSASQHREALWRYRSEGQTYMLRFTIILVTALDKYDQV